MYFLLKYATLTVALLSQQALGTLPIRDQSGYTGYMTFSEPLQTIVGIYRAHGALSVEETMQIALAASTDEVSVAIQHKLSTPKGVTIFLSNENPGDLVIAAMGAGTGEHGEGNIVRICDKSGIEVCGGSVVTFTRDGVFRPACGRPPINGPPTGCQKIVDRYEWMDIFKDLRDFYLEMGKPSPPSPEPEKSRSSSPRPFRS